MLGYATPKELLDASGGNIIGLAHPDDVKVGLADALNQYTHSDHYATIYRIRCKDGTYKYIEDRGQKVIKEDGTIEHWNLIQKMTSCTNQLHWKVKKQIKASLIFSPGCLMI